MEMTRGQKHCRKTYEKVVMNKQIIINTLTQNHNYFIEVLSKLSSQEFLENRNGKYSAGQHLEHTYISIKPSNQVLSLPKFLLKLIFKTANRESKTNQELAEKYKLKLESGAAATSAFIPKIASIKNREKHKI